MLDTTYTFTIFIDGSQLDSTKYFLESGGLSVREGEGSEINTATIVLVDNVGDFDESAVAFKEIVVYGNYGLSSQITVFGGIIVKPNVSGLQQDFGRLVTLECEGYASFLRATEKLRTSYTNMSAGAIVASMFSTLGLTQFDTSTYVDTGPTIEVFNLHGENIAKALDRLSELCGYVWYIDYDKNVIFKAQTGYSAPFAVGTVVDSDYSTRFPMQAGSWTLNPDSTNIINKVIIYGGYKDSAKQTEYFSGDGSTVRFSLANKPIRRIDRISYYTGGVWDIQSHGVAWYDTFGGGFDCLVNYAAGSIEFATAPAAGTNNIKVEYYYEEQVKVVRDRTNNTTAAASYTKFGRDFVYEIEDRSISSDSEATALADAIISNYSDIRRSGSFSIEKYGLHPSMYLDLQYNPEGFAESVVIRRVTYELNATNEGFVCNVEWGGRETKLSQLFNDTISTPGMVNEPVGGPAYSVISNPRYSGEVGTFRVRDAIMIGAEIDDYLTGVGIFMGLNANKYRMHIGDPSGDHLAWDGTNLYVTGNFIGGSNIFYTEADSFTINYDRDVASSSLIFGGSGGDAYVDWDGSKLLIGATYDVDIGSGVLYMDISQTNIGINRLPDAQFDLDINGSMRAGGYIVGKHAIQLPDTAMICHFDGLQPYKTNFSGSAFGHMGQVPIIYGGVIFRPGKFGKAVQLAESGTNYIGNPRAENDLGWWSTVDVEVTRDTTTSFIGSACFRLAANTSTYVDLISPQIAANENELWTYSLYYKEDDGQWDYFYHTVTTSVGATWIQFNLYRSPTGELRIRIDDSNGMLGYWTISANSPTYFYVDAIMAAKTDYPIPYIDGDLGDGYSWAGTPHASESIRSSAYIDYDYDTLFETSGAVGFWYKRLFVSRSAQDMVIQGNGGDYLFVSTFYGYLRCRVVDGVTNFGSSIDFSTWHHIVLAWDNTSFDVYLDGDLLGSLSHSAFSSLPTSLRLNASGNGWIDDLFVMTRKPGADEIKAIYDSNAPIFAETSSWSFSSSKYSNVWTDDEGLWVKDVDGNEVFGVYGSDGSKLWGGQTLNTGDIMIGRSGKYVFWDNDLGNMIVKASIYAIDGEIGGWTIGSNTLYSGNLVLDAASQRIYFGSAYLSWASGSQLNVVGLLYQQGAGGIYAVDIIHGLSTIQTDLKIVTPEIEPKPGTSSVTMSGSFLISGNLYINTINSFSGGPVTFVRDLDLNSNSISGVSSISAASISTTGAISVGTNVEASGYVKGLYPFQYGAYTGVSGNFTSADGKSINVAGGLIVSIT